MQALKVLVLTDHMKHSAQNSLYALVQAMRLHANCAQIDVATRGDQRNAPFFTLNHSEELHVVKVDEHFTFSKEGTALMANTRKRSFSAYDLVWLRLPPPLSVGFLNYLEEIRKEQLIINAPKAIYATGSKEFLMQFPDLCPTMQVCKTAEDIIAFKAQFPIVLKPFREYGGRGIVRIDGNRVWEGNKEQSFDAFIETFKTTNGPYLAVRFLKNVDQGDKRIIVVNGKIMGASLRLPAKGSWLCNVAMGGTASFAKVDGEEEAIVHKLNPVLSKMGIVMYGIDTLVDDDGKRVLSEINTTSIGGLPDIAKELNKPLVEEAIDLIFDYSFLQLAKNADDGKAMSGIPIKPSFRRNND